MIRPIPFVILFLCALFATFIVLAAWECLRANRKQKRIARMAHDCATGKMPRGLKDKLMRRILEARLDE